MKNASLCMEGEVDHAPSATQIKKTMTVTTAMTICLCIFTFTLNSSCEFFLSIAVASDNASRFRL